jgi:hypothetical protein
VKVSIEEDGARKGERGKKERGRTVCIHKGRHHICGARRQNN